MAFVVETCLTGIGQQTQCRQPAPVDRFCDHSHLDGASTAQSDIAGGSELQPSGVFLHAKGFIARESFTAISVTWTNETAGHFHHWSKCIHHCFDLDDQGARGSHRHVYLNLRGWASDHTHCGFDSSSRF